MIKLVLEVSSHHHQDSVAHSRVTAGFVSLNNTARVTVASRSRAQARARGGDHLAITWRRRTLSSWTTARNSRTFFCVWSIDRSISIDRAQLRRRAPHPRARAQRRQRRRVPRADRDACRGRGVVLVGRRLGGWGVCGRMSHAPDHRRPRARRRAACAAPTARTRRVP